VSDAIEFVQARGEYASLLAVALLLWLSAGPTARLLALPRRELADLLWNGGVAFVVVGRLAYVGVESPRTLLDPLVLIRLQGGIEPLAGALGVAAVVAWRARRRDGAWAWATAAAAGLAVATVGYDLACVLRDACYGTAAPPPLGFEMSGFSQPRLATPLVEATVLLALGAALLRFAHRVPAEVIALLMIGALALVRAALTPASVLGTDAIGLETMVLGLVGVVAIAAAVAMRFVAPERRVGSSA
jgi:prolipoprotein diacylglyceryltransferase